MKPISDNELIRRCIARDSVAWHTLIDRYGRLVGWAVQREIRRREEWHQFSDDLFQMVWTKIWEGGCLKNLKATSSLSAWIISLTIYEVRSWIRKEIRQGRTQEVPIGEASSGGAFETQKNKNPFEEASSKEVQELIADSFSKLPPRECLVLRLYFEEELQIKQIAETLQIPINTVLSIIHRSRKQVQDMLREKGI